MRENLSNRMRLLSIASMTLFMLSLSVESSFAATVESDDSTSIEHKNLTLEDCIQIAMERNRSRTASAYEVETAEALHGQARSARWPMINLDLIYARLDESPNFLFPAVEMPIPDLDMGGLNITLPTIYVPEQDIKLMNEQTLAASFRFVLPIYTGGLIPSFIRQAEYGIQIANEASRRSDLQIVFDVTRSYYAVILVGNLIDIGETALARLEATLDLTENLYKKGSGRVKKTDYLKNKIVVENIRSFIRGLKDQNTLAEAALLFSMGLKRSVDIVLASNEIPYQPNDISLNETIETSYAYNPDWKRLQWALRVFESKVTEARSGHFPRVVLVGGFTHLGNDYDFGMVTPQNKNMWTVGIGLDFNLFSGFRTKNRVKEAKARLGKLTEQQIVMREGLALQIQRAFSTLVSLQDRYRLLTEAYQSAVENRDLTERAYQSELMTEQDLIESQILESIMEAQVQKVLYDHAEVQAHLEFLVGSEIHKHLQSL